MRTRKAQALLLSLAAVVAATANCGKGSSGGAGGATGGPTDVTVSWTFAGKPASADECTARMGTQVYVNLSASVDPKLHQSNTVGCSAGSVVFKALDTESLGMPFIEGALLDDKGMTITNASLTVMPVVGKTAVTLDFFPVMGMGGGSATSGPGPSSSTSGPASSSATSGPGSSSATSGGGGGGGAGGAGSTGSSATSGSAGGAGGAAASSSTG